MPRPGGGIGRHAGLKILWPVMAVRVQLPSRVLFLRLAEFQNLGLTLIPVGMKDVDLNNSIA